MKSGRCIFWCIFNSECIFRTQKIHKKIHKKIHLMEDTLVDTHWPLSFNYGSTLLATLVRSLPINDSAQRDHVSTKRSLCPQMHFERCATPPLGATAVARGRRLLGRAFWYVECAPHLSDHACDSWCAVGRGQLSAGSSSGVRQSIRNSMEAVARTWRVHESTSDGTSRLGRALQRPAPRHDRLSHSHPRASRRVHRRPQFHLRSVERTSCR